MFNHKNFLILFIGTLSFFWMGCSKSPQDPVLAGGVSVTTNGFAMYSDSSVAEGAVVRLRPYNYLADLNPTLPSSPFMMDTITNDSGFYDFGVLANGEYTIEINDKNGFAAKLAFIKTSEDPKDLPIAVLEPTTALSGKVDLFVADFELAFIQIEGMERIAQVDKITGDFVVEGLPVGQYEIHLSVQVDENPENDENKKIDSIIVPSIENHVSDTIILPEIVGTGIYSQWSFKKSITLNTSSSGANNLETLTNFPVLIRLDTTNFDLWQTHINDVRFGRNDSISLPYEIEYWDMIGQQAVVWVKVDSIYGNNSNQTIEIYWGNDTANSESNGAGVFDSDNNYAGVWHLGETSDNTGSNYQDATFLPANGTGVNLTSWVRANGMIGYAQDLEDSLHQYIVIDGAKEAKFDFTNKFMVSSWIKVESFNKNWAAIITKGEGSWRFHRADSQSVLEIAANGLSPRHYLQGSVPVDDGEWHHAVGGYDGQRFYLYVDGNLDTSHVANGTIDTDDIIPAIIGENTSMPGRSWDGVLDEIQVMGEFKSENWIRLSYENQKADQTLVQFK